MLVVLLQHLYYIFCTSCSCRGSLYYICGISCFNCNVFHICLISAVVFFFFFFFFHICCISCFYCGLFHICCISCFHCGSDFAVRLSRLPQHLVYCSTLYSVCIQGMLSLRTNQPLAWSCQDIRPSPALQPTTNKPEHSIIRAH